MKNSKTPLLLLSALAIGGLLFWRMWSEPGPIPTGRAPSETASVEKSDHKIKYPMASVAGGKSVAQNSQDNDGPIPKLGQSDNDFQQKAPALFGRANFADVVIFENFISHFAIAVENATGKQIPANLSPIKTAHGELIVTASGDDFILSTKNYKRYQSYVDVAQTADLKKIVGYYRRVYPLFQAAYQELGVDGYFNDKLIEVIDNLLATPSPKGPIILKSPSVRYVFADPELESLSAIQKILIRMGPDSEKIIKAKFKELRDLLLQPSS